MSLSYYKVSKDLVGKWNTGIVNFWLRRYGSGSSDKPPDFINSTILVEDGLNVRELPVIVRKLRDLSDETPPRPEVPTAPADASQYHLIQAEFRQCTNLRDIFSLLSKCIKITPNIALGAMERICDIEKTSNLPVPFDTSLMNVQLAKGAILDKLLKVVLQTEDTQTILNALKVDSIVLEPYKHKFCDELLFRVIDNKLSIQQLAEFVTVLASSRKNQLYDDTIDKLWVGFMEKQDDINEKNVVQLLNISCHFKTSKATVMLLLEKKLWSFWWKMNVGDMQEILSIFIEENNLSSQSLGVVGRWLNTNIHILDEDSLLDFVTKLTRLQYTDLQIESAIERFIKTKRDHIQSQVLIVGILNYCITFRIRNKNILNGCSQYFAEKGDRISHSFLKSFIYPFGFLYYNPENNQQFWAKVEERLKDKLAQMSCDDIVTILLSSLYIGEYPFKLINLVFNPQFLTKLSRSDNSEQLQRKLCLLDTALSLECKSCYNPYFSKEDWPQPVTLDVRIRKLTEEMETIMKSVANGDYKVSTSILLPDLCPDETYSIDFLLHPECLDTYNFNWITKSEKNKTIAVLIHLPEHYCYNSNQLIGAQMLRKKHMRLLGMRVVSLSYTLICKLQSNKIYLEKYIKNCIENAEMFL